MILNKNISERIFDVCNILFQLLFAFVCIFPFYYLLIYSFSDPQQAYKVILWPIGFTLENYKRVLTLNGIGTAAMVSVLKTFLGTLVMVCCCSFFGYLVTKQNMPGRKLIYRLQVISMYVSGGLIPTFLVYNAYGLMNNWLVYILPGALSAYNIILVKTFTEQIPISLEESAMIEGAGTIRCWWSIIVPLSKPILATITVFGAVDRWNAWFDTHIYVTNKTMWSLQYTLYRFLQQVQSTTDLLKESGNSSIQAYLITPETVRMTIAAVVTLPILFVYPYMQRYFMKGILIGAVKG